MRMATMVGFVRPLVRHRSPGFRQTHLRVNKALVTCSGSPIQCQSMPTVSGMPTLAGQGSGPPCAEGR